MRISDWSSDVCSSDLAEHPIYPLGLTVGGVNMDVLNVNGRTKNVVVTGYGKSDLDALIVPLAKAQGRRVEPEAHHARGGYYRSDHFSFAKLGVPTLEAGSGEALRAGSPAAAMGDAAWRGTVC